MWNIFIIFIYCKINKKKKILIFHILLIIAFICTQIVLDIVFALPD